MKIYFAASIRGGGGEQNIQAEIISLLSHHGQVLTEHVGDASLTSVGENKASEHIFERDVAWLEEADAVVAEVTMPSLGVGYEMEKGESLKKKILCVYRPSDDRHLSAMIDGNPALTTQQYAQVGDLKQIFDKFFKK